MTEKNKITEKTKLSEVVQRDNKAAEILLNEGLSCFGCPMAMEETLGDGCLAHGMSKKQIEGLIKKLNGGK